MSRKADPGRREGLLPSLALIGIQSTLVRTEYLAAVAVAFLSFLLLFSFFVEAVNSVENV